MVLDPVVVESSTRTKKCWDLQVPSQRVRSIGWTVVGGSEW